MSVSSQDAEQEPDRAASLVRRQTVDRLVADPPIVHRELGNPDGGVWRTDRDCYECLAEACAPGARTLETGLGISTALFLLLGTRHTCVTLYQSEGDHLLAYCRDRGISTDDLDMRIGYSDEILPTLHGDLDVVFLDGGHAFPMPMIDWYYAGSRLRLGGLVVIDDIHLPAVRLLTRYLDDDPRWSVRTRTSKWVAYERMSAGPLRDEWTDQLFYKP